MARFRLALEIHPGLASGPFFPCVFKPKHLATTVQALGVSQAETFPYESGRRLHAQGNAEDLWVTSPQPSLPSGIML